MTKLFFTAGLFLFFAGTVAAQEFYGKFINAYQAKDYPNCIKHGNELVNSFNDPDTLYKLAQCYGENDQPAESLKILNRLADLGLTYRIAEHAKLQKLRRQKGWQNLLGKFEKNLRPVDNSVDAFTLGDNNLIPEGIAAVSDGSKFFVGSLFKNKIVEYSAGNERDLIKSGQDGIWSIVGMKVSPDDRELWVCSFAERSEFAGFAGLFGFDPASGKLVAKYVLDNKNGPHLFNDLVIAKDGRIFFTDSKAGRVLRIDRRTKKIEPLLNRDFIYPNGIALDEKTNALFVADFGGVTRIDLKTGRAVSLNAGDLTYLNGVDGLYFYDGSLVAVQNPGEGADRVARFFLDRSQTKVTGVKILQSFHPDFNIPTTGTLAGDDFYYIANSSLLSIKPDGTLADADQVKKPLIKKIKLKTSK